MHRATPRFWRSYEELPEEMQRLANKCFELLKQDRRHPSLQLKKVGRLWSIRVGLQYRALAAEEAGDMIWFWIGSHAEYDRLLGHA